MHKALLAALVALVPAPVLADTLILNANGIQVGADGKLQHFKGLLIDEQGKVVRTLAATDAPPANARRVIDVGGRTLLPGLIDAHGHVSALGFAALQLDLTGTQSLAELQQRLKDYAAANPTARWILGRGWNQELWADKRFPTAADIDVAVSDRPVWLGRVDGHAAIANSAAMQAAGFSINTAVPAGGRVENGLFVDAAMTLVDSKVPPPTEAELDAALAKAQEIMLSNGLTAAADMGTTEPEFRATIRACGNAGALRVRVLSYLSPEYAAKVGTTKPTSWTCSDRMWAGGVKMYADGALGSRGALLKHPYADKPDTRGLSLISEAELRKRTDLAASQGYQLAIHAIGDEANAEVISAFEQLSKKYGRDRRWRIEHFQIADPVDIPRLAPAGIIASMQPTHQTSDRLMAEARLGPARLKGAYAWQTVLKSGARLAFGSDFPVESPNPFPGLAAAVSRQDMNGQPPGGWYPEERLTFEQALSAFTRDAAYASFAESRFGSLEAGKWADFIIVDRDISKVDPQALARTQVLESWLAGRKMWSRPSAAGAERGK